MLARIDQVTVRQPTSSASRVARSSWRLVIVTLAPRRIRPKAIGRATPPAPRISTCLSNSGLASSSLVAAAHGGFERIHRRAVVGVVADPPAVLLEDDRVAGPGPLDGPLLLLQERHDRLLVGDRDAAPLDVQPEQLLEERRQLAVGDQERHHDLVQPELAERGVVDRGAQALLDRVADDAVDLGLGVDLVVGDSRSSGPRTGSIPAAKTRSGLKPA